LFQTRTLTTVVYPFFLSRLNTFASRSLAIEISAVGSLKVYSSTTSIISTPANTIQNGQAYHILFIFQAPNIISLYLNGNLYVTKNNNAFKNLFNTPQYAAFGYRFTGFIDMVRFDDTAFTPAEASNAFQSLGSLLSFFSLFFFSFLKFHQNHYYFILLKKNRLVWSWVMSWIMLCKFSFQ